jgi:hypothetical protein
VFVDRVLADAERAGDLLGRQVLIDQAQDFPLARGQPLDQVARLFAQVRHTEVILTAPDAPGPASEFRTAIR